MTSLMYAAAGAATVAQPVRHLPCHAVNGGSAGPTAPNRRAVGGDCVRGGVCTLGGGAQHHPAGDCHVGLRSCSLLLPRPLYVFSLFSVILAVCLTRALDNL